MTHITVNSLSPALGAEISNVDLHSPISPATLAEIKLAWDEHLVLRNQIEKCARREVTDSEA